jgi:hypothetical protein
MVIRNGRRWSQAGTFHQPDFEKYRCPVDKKQKGDYVEEIGNIPRNEG